MRTLTRKSPDVKKGWAKSVSSGLKMRGLVKSEMSSREGLLVL